MALLKGVCQAACGELLRDGVVLFWEPCCPYWQENTHLQLIYPND